VQLPSILHQPNLSLPWSSGLQDGAPPSVEPPVPSVSISPESIAKRRFVAARGMAMEIVQMTRHDVYEAQSSSSWHLLVAYEQAERREGNTTVEGLAPSTRRNCSGRMVFVPAERDFRDWHDPCRLALATYVYLDPRLLVTECGARSSEVELKPRVFFENANLWQTVQKLKRTSDVGADDQLYRDALGVVLSHELLCLGGDDAPQPQVVRGGLAGWQSKRVLEYIEEHIAEPISLTSLADVARLSPTHFARAFKQSFGMPPHGYHVHRRVERAKIMLADPIRSITEVALACGFSASSSFSTVFRRTCGRTPMSYRRSLV
jgi:AraC family transcriptional regulator